MSNQEESDAEIAADWRQNPGTFAERIKAQAKRAMILRNLLSDCGVSTDPVVRGAVERYKSCDELVKLLGGKTLLEEMKHG